VTVSLIRVPLPARVGHPCPQAVPVLSGLDESPVETGPVLQSNLETYEETCMSVTTTDANSPEPLRAVAYLLT
jgi:hypothetical protein